MSMRVKEVFCSLGVPGSRQGRRSDSEDKVDYMDLLMKMGIGNINIFINASGNNSYVDIGDIGVLLGSDVEFDDDYYYYDDDYTTNFMRTTTSTSTTTTTSTTTATESKKRRK